MKKILLECIRKEKCFEVLNILQLVSVGSSRYSSLITLSVCVVRWLMYFTFILFRPSSHCLSPSFFSAASNTGAPPQPFSPRVHDRTYFIFCIKETEYNLVLADAAIAATATASMTMKCTFSFHSFSSTYTSIMTGGIRQIYTKLHLINSPILSHCREMADAVDGCFCFSFSCQLPLIYA